MIVGCGPKYFSERLKLERVYKYALRMGNELQFILVCIFGLFIARCREVMQ